MAEAHERFRVRASLTFFAITHVLRDTVGTRIKVIPSFGKGTLPTLVFKVGGPQGYPSDLSPSVS